MASFTLSTFLCVTALSCMAWAHTEFCQGPCPGGWVYYNQRCFRYFGKKSNWIDAEESCLSLGGNLASEKTDEDHAFLKELQKHAGQNEPFWIGLSDIHKEGTWLWSDGTRMQFTKWNSGEPNNSEPDKDWNDKSCGFTYPYMCAK